MNFFGFGGKSKQKESNQSRSNLLESRVEPTYSDLSRYEKELKKREKDSSFGSGRIQSESLTINVYDGLDRSKKENRQYQGVMSIKNESYFCEVLCLTLIENEMDSSQVKGFIIEFAARGDASNGPTNQPHNARLYIRKEEHTPASFNVKSATFTLVVGTITFILQPKQYLLKEALFHTIIKFRYGEINSGYSKVHLLMPMQYEKSCPHCAKVNLSVTEDIHDVYYCNNCHNTSNGYHWYCHNDKECGHQYCFRCISAFHQQLQLCSDCKNDKMHWETGETSKPGLTRYCENCKQMLSNGEFQTCSCYQHCDVCNFNLCRSCSFHPGNEYHNPVKSQGLEEEFEMVLKGHKDDITSIYIVRNSRAPYPCMISTSKDNTAMIWDISTGWLKQTLKGHTDWIRSGIIVYNQPDNVLFAVTVSDDTQAYVWDLTTNLSENTLPITKFEKHTGNVYAAAEVSLAVGTAIITVGGDGFAYVWNMYTGEEYENYRNDLEEEIYSVLVAPNNSKGEARVVFGTPSRVIMIEMENPASNAKRPSVEYINSAPGIAVEILKLFYSENEEWLLLGSDRAVAQFSIVWDLETGVQLYRIKAPSKMSAVAVYHGDIVAGCVGGELLVWSREDEEKSENNLRLPKHYGPNQFYEVTALEIFDFKRNCIDTTSPAVYKDLILVSAIEYQKDPSINIFRMTQISDDDKPVLTVEDVTADVPNNFLNEGLMKSVIVPLDRSRARKIISIQEVSMSGIPLVVAATSERFSVVDMYSSAVVFEHVFVKMKCTAMTVFGFDKRPLVACGGNIDSVNRSEGAKKDSKADDKDNHVIKVWDISSGQLVKSVFWETKIEVMSAGFDIQGNPHLITSGFPPYRGDTRRIVFWDVTTDLKTSVDCQIVLATGDSTSSKTRTKKRNDYAKIQRLTSDLVDGSTSIYQVYLTPAAELLLYTYQVNPFSLIGKPIVIAEKVELWTTYKLDYYPNVTKIVSLLIHDTSSEESKSSKLNSRKVITFDIDPDGQKREASSNLHLFNIKDSSNECYYMAAAGYKELDYVIFVFTVDRSLDRARANNITSPREKGRSSPNHEEVKFGVGEDSIMKSGKLDNVKLSDSSKNVDQSSKLKPGVKSQSQKKDMGGPTSGKSKIVVFDVHSNKVYHTLYTYGKVNHIRVWYPQQSLQKEPLILIACDDGTVLTWNFKKFITADGFETNIKNFREGVKEKHPPGFWLEHIIPDKQDPIKYVNTMFLMNNQKIIYEAADRKVESFFRDFKNIIAPHAYLFSRAVDIAIAAQNPRLVKILMNYWLVLLNEDVINKDNPKDWFHRPSAFLNLDTLLAIANGNAVMAREFVNFISGIQLIKSPPDLKGVEESFEFDGSIAITSGSAIYGEAVDVWRKNFKSSPSASSDAFFIPLKDAGNYAMLQAYVTASETLDDVSIFNSPAVIYAIKLAWRQYGRKVHYFQMLKYFAFIVLFTAYIFNFERWTTNGSYLDFIVLWVIQIILFVVLVQYAYAEYLEIPFVSIDEGAREAAISDGVDNYQPVTRKFFRKLHIHQAFSHQSILHYPSVVIKNVWNAFWKVFLLILVPLDEITSIWHIYLGFHFAFILAFFGFKGDLLDRIMISSDFYEKFVGEEATILLIPRILFLYLPALAYKGIWNSACYGFALGVTISFKILLLEYFNSSNLYLFYKHFTDFWNINDLLVFGFGIPGIVLRAIYMEDGGYSTSWLGIASIASWFKVLYFLRPFEVSGRLVSTILEMAFEIRYFVLILSIVLTGFAQAFWLMENQNAESGTAFSDIRHSFLQSFLLIFGQYPSSDDIGVSANPQLTQLFVIMFTLVCTLLMLNLLIALMSDAYGKIRDNGLAQWRYEQATIILEETRKAPKLPYLPYIHILKSTDLDGSDDTLSNTDKKLYEMADKLANLQTMLDDILNPKKPEETIMEAVRQQSEEDVDDEVPTDTRDFSPRASDW